MKIEFEVDEHAVLEMMRECCGDDVTMKMVTDIVLKDTGVLANIYMWGHTETETLSLCSDVLSKKLIDMRWPTYGDTDEYKKEFDIKWERALKDYNG